MYVCDVMGARKARRKRGGGRTGASHFSHPRLTNERGRDPLMPSLTLMSLFYLRTNKQYTFMFPLARDPTHGSFLGVVSSVMWGHVF